MWAETRNLVSTVGRASQSPKFVSLSGSLLGGNPHRSLPSRLACYDTKPTTSCQGSRHVSKGLRQTPLFCQSTLSFTFTPTDCVKLGWVGSTAWRWHLSSSPYTWQAVRPSSAPIVADAPGRSSGLRSRVQQDHCRKSPVRGQDCSPVQEWHKKLDLALELQPPPCTMRTNPGSGLWSATRFHRPETVRRSRSVKTCTASEGFILRPTCGDSSK